MKTKKTKKTPKPGEIKPINSELLTEMIKISNNSILTKENALLISNKLSDSEMREFLRWIRHANTEVNSKINIYRRKF